MHQKTPKIDFFVIFRNLQKKLPICKKKYAKILNSVRAVVTDVENRQNGTSEGFLGSTFCVTDCSLKMNKILADTGALCLSKVTAEITAENDENP